MIYFSLISNVCFCLFLFFRKVQAQLLQFAAKNIGLNPALLTSPINPQQMTLLYQLQQLQVVSHTVHSLALLFPMNTSYFSSTHWLVCREWDYSAFCLNNNHICLLYTISFFFFFFSISLYVPLSHLLSFSLFVRHISVCRFSSKWCRLSVMSLVPSNNKSSKYDTITQFCLKK